MNKLLNILIIILISSYPLQIFALCIGTCTPNYSPMHSSMINSSPDLTTVDDATKRHTKPKCHRHTTSQKPKKIIKQNAIPCPTHIPTIKQSGTNNYATNTTNTISNNPNLNNSNPNYRYNKNINPFNFSLYKPTYVLPIYYNTKPDYAVYSGNTPDNQSLEKSEFDFQISFKVPLWQDIFFWPDTLYAAYSQDSYWQLYTNSPYFRETNYEPEIFLDNEINKPIGGSWVLSDLDVGAMHQSNGRGGDLERSWNRAYFNSIFTNGNWMVSIEPWTLIFKGVSSDEHNPNITHFLGYGQEMIAYKYDQNTFSFTTRNVFESGFSRGAEWLTWSFPLIHRNLKGYVYLFSGYGYDLIEYNHYTNGAGLGVTLNDWM